MRSAQVALLFAFALASSPAATAQGVTLYSTDFSSWDGWTSGGLGCDGGDMWSVDATPANHPAGPFFSAPASLNFNNGVDYGDDSCDGEDACGRAESPPIDLTLASGIRRATFRASWNTETGCNYDLLTFRVTSGSTGEGSPLMSVCINVTQTSQWHPFEFDLDPAWGTVRLRFQFETVDGCMNNLTGPFVDDVAVVAQGALFCFGDGSSGPCPCGNQSPAAARAGCLHSLGTGGRLRTQGAASLSADTLVLLGSTMPNQPTLYFQGATALPATPFGDGLRCAGSPFVRLGTKTNSGGGSSYPGPGDPSVSSRGMVTTPGTRYYTAWFRDPASFCAPETFGLTNAVEIVWEL